MLTAVAHNGGNFLLNVGPEANGTIQAEAVKVIEEVGQWLQVNGESVYGTSPSPFNYIDQEISTAGNDAVYISLHADYGPEKLITGIANTVNSITLLDTNENVDFIQEEGRIFLKGLSYPKPGAMPRVLKLELSAPPKGVINPIWRPERFRTC
jgi:alpha-L-fucosidase